MLTVTGMVVIVVNIDEDDGQAEKEGKTVLMLFQGVVGSRRRGYEF